MAKANARGDVTVTLSDGRVVTLSLTLGAMDQVEQLFDCGFEEAAMQLADDGPGRMGRLARFVSALTYGQPDGLTVDEARLLSFVDLAPMMEGVAAIMAAANELAASDTAGAGAPGE